MIINPAQLNELLADGIVLEQFRPDLPKVIKLKVGEFVKFFRVKHLISKYRFINPAKHFARNAARLAKREIPALQHVRHYRVPHKKLWAVRYQGREGVSVRELLLQGQLSAGTPRWMAEHLVTLEGVKAAGWAAEATSTVPDVLGRPAEPIAAFVQRHATRLR